MAKIRNMLIMILIVLSFSIPTLVGYLNKDMVFSGLSTTDGNTYLSFMNQAKEGKILFTNMYTPEEIISQLLFPMYN